MAEESDNLPTSVSVSIDPGVERTLDDALDGIWFNGHSAADVARQAAVSRTITAGVTLIRRKIGEQVNLKQSDIAKVITSKRGSYDDPSGSITVTRKTSWLGDFLSGSQARRIKAGKAAVVKGPLTVQVRKKPSGKYGTSEVIPRAFAGTVPRSPKVGVFQRQGRQRLPLHRLRGPSALGVFENATGDSGKNLVDETVLDLTDVLEKNYQSQIDRFKK